LKLKTAFIFLTFFFYSYTFGSLQLAEKYLEEQKFTQALEELNKENDPKNLAYNFYLQGWAYYGNKDYSKALEILKTLVSTYSQSEYVMSSLLLSAHIHLLQNKQEQALKICQWVLSQKSSVEAQILAKSMIQKIENKKRVFKPNLEFLILDFIFKLSYSDSLPLSLKNEKSFLFQKHIQGLSQFTNLPEVLFKEKKEVNLDKENLDKIKDFQKQIQLKQKELEVWQILLEEKKKLLFLKEQYLLQKEKAQQDLEEKSLEK